MPSFIRLANTSGRKIAFCNQSSDQVLRSFLTAGLKTRRTFSIRKLRLEPTRRGKMCFVGRKQQ
jgi:hypothetical protein